VPHHQTSCYLGIVCASHCHCLTSPFCPSPCPFLFLCSLLFTFLPSLTQYQPRASYCQMFISNHLYTHSHPSSSFNGFSKSFLISDQKPRQKASFKTERESDKKKNLRVLKYAIPLFFWFLSLLLQYNGHQETSKPSLLHLLCFTAICSILYIK